MLNFLRKSKGMLGMNARNLLYIRPHNKKRGFQIADNKILTKKILENHDIPIPKIYGVVRGRRGLKEFDWGVLPETFVLKPNLGYGGEGILVVFGRRKDGNWIAHRGAFNFFDLISHVYNILDGNFSLTDAPDIAFFEERVKIDKVLKPYAFKGIPDIRVIVYNHAPVMAELRLPTRLSGGKANLHQGGVGVGIDIATGTTTTAIQWDRLIERHPDNNLRLRGIRIPYWDQILTMAVRTQQVTKIGFLGVDIAIDRERGPVVLEINVRPGLAIQIANLGPLKERLRRVEGLKIPTADKGVRVAKELFGGEIEEEVEQMTGRHIVGMVEKVKLFNIKGEEAGEVDAKIDTGADFSSVSFDLAEHLGYGEILQKFQTFKEQLSQKFTDPELLAQEVSNNQNKYAAEVSKLDEHLVGVKIVRAANGVTVRPVIKIDFILAGIRITSKPTVADRRKMKYQILVGRGNLKRFLLDPNR